MALSNNRICGASIRMKKSNEPLETGGSVRVGHVLDHSASAPLRETRRNHLVFSRLAVWR
jgi:hypothetical protein